jgi:hypothetical protein
VRSWAWLLAGVAVVATALAVAFRSSPASAASFGALAVLLGSALLVGLLLDRRERVPAPVSVPLYPPDLLERAFESGTLGRQRVIVTIESLQGLSLAHPRRLTPDEVRELERSSDERFRAWVADRLTALEQAS